MSACGIPLVNGICSGVSSVVERTTRATVSDVIRSVAEWISAGARSTLQDLWDVLTASPNLKAPWFLAHEQVMVTIAAALAVPILLATVIQSIIRQDASLALRAAFVHLPLAALLTGMAVQLVEMGLHLTDQLCTVVIHSTGGSLEEALVKEGARFAAVAGAPRPPSLAAVLIILTALFAGLLLWMELMIREAAIYVAVLFLPLGMVSLVWPAIAHWGKRLAHLLVSLILSKFVVVAVLSLALGALTSGTLGPDGLSALLSGATLLLLAAFAPFVLLRMLPMAEGAALLEGARSQVVQRATAVPRKAVDVGMRAASVGALGGFGAVGAAGTGAGVASEGAAAAAPASETSTSGADAAVSGHGTAAAGGAGASGRWGTGTFGRAMARAAGSAGAGTTDRAGTVGSAGAGSRSGSGGHGGAGGLHPAWQGQPATNRAFERSMADSAGDRGPGGDDGDGGDGAGPLGAAGATASRLGGPPVWGIPLDDLDSGDVDTDDTDGGEAPVMSVSRRDGGSRVIGHDDLGPVIRWIPDEGDPMTGEPR